MSTAFIGQPVSRVDGRRKVTGGATYAAEFRVPGVAHNAIVRSTVANGRIASLDTEAAERAPGVVAVVTHRNAPRLAYRSHKAAPDPRVGESASACTCFRTTASTTRASRSASS